MMKTISIVSSFPQLSVPFPTLYFGPDSRYLPVTTAQDSAGLAPVSHARLTPRLLLASSLYAARIYILHNSPFASCVHRDSSFHAHDNNPLTPDTRTLLFIILTTN